MAKKLTSNERKLLAAIKGLVREFETGASCNTMNPYARPCVKTALNTAKEVTGLRCDWLDVTERLSDFDI